MKTNPAAHSYAFSSKHNITPWDSTTYDEYTHPYESDFSDYVNYSGLVFTPLQNSRILSLCSRRKIANPAAVISSRYAVINRLISRSMTPGTRCSST